jgi:hypothetical protein
MLGLSRGDSNQNYPDIDFALYQALNTVQVYETGVLRGSFGTLVSGDHLRVSVEGGVVKYRKNGALLYTSAVAPAFPLLVDTSLYTVGATLTDVVLSGELVDAAVAAPLFAPPDGTYDAPQNVAITTGTPGAAVHYTANGVDPTEADLILAPGATLAIAQNTTLKARAWSAGYFPSAVSTAAYAFVTGAPVFEPAPGAYAGSVMVTMTTATPDASIRCTTDDTPPTGSSPLCAGAITLSATTTLRAKAFRAGWPASPETSGTYIVTMSTLDPPTAAPTPGTFTTSVSVELAATAGATIHYTLDGLTEPTCSSPAYAAPLTLTATTTVRALACQDGWLPSPATLWQYLVQVAAPTFAPEGGSYPGPQSVVVNCATPVVV